MTTDNGYYYWSANLGLNGNPAHPAIEDFSGRLWYDLEWALELQVGAGGVWRLT